MDERIKELKSLLVVSDEAFASVADNDNIGHVDQLKILQRRLESMLEFVSQKVEELNRKMTDRLESFENAMVDLAWKVDGGRRKAPFLQCAVWQASKGIAHMIEHTMPSILADFCKKKLLCEIHKAMRSVCL